jgi:hypothetical protein
MGGIVTGSVYRSLLWALAIRPGYTVTLSAPYDVFIIQRNRYE